MPTGYTADIKDGISFEQFVWNCARAFGATVTMRDDPAGTPIPERFEPSPFYAKHVEEAEAKLSRLRALTTEQAHAECIAEYKRDLAAWVKRRSDRNELRIKYEAMLAKVTAWEAPTPEHDGLKEFMQKQIRESINWDCFHKYDDGPACKATDAWLAAAIASAERELIRAQESHREEMVRVESRNGWLKALRESVPMPQRVEG